MNRIITIGLILLGFFTLQSCSSNNKDNSSETANQAETMEVEEEYSVPQYELIPVAHNDARWSVSSALAVKQNGKFVVFDNDADYSALGPEAILYYYAYFVCAEKYKLTDDENRELAKSLAPLVQKYLRDKSAVRGHEHFSIVDKAYYDCQTLIEDYFYKEYSSYDYHRYSNGPGGSSFKCFGDSDRDYYTPDGEKIPSNALVIC